MRVRRRRPLDPGRAAPIVADAREQALWDAQGRPHPHRRQAVAMIALGVAVVLVLGALVIARARPEGDILALGSTTASTGLPAADEPGSSQAGGAGDLAGVAPGDTVPGGGPAGAAPAGVGDAGPGVAGAPGAAGGAPTGTGTGGAGGPGPGAGVPVPTTGSGGPAGSTGTSPSIVPPAGGVTLPTTPTTPPNVAPPLLPTCSIGSAAATPNPVRRKGNGQLHDDVVVTFRGDSCGMATFQVAWRGISAEVVGTGGGGWSARIGKSTTGWSVGTFPITITGGGSVATVLLEVKG